MGIIPKTLCVAQAEDENPALCGAMAPLGGLWLLPWAALHQCANGGMERRVAEIHVAQRGKEQWGVLPGGSNAGAGP